MTFQEFEGATKLRLEYEKVKAHRDRLLKMLRDLYRDANPTILDDSDTGVRLSPEWDERILKEIQDENQETP